MTDIFIEKNSMLVEKRDNLKISWSKLRQYFECPASWFCINYATFVNVREVQIDQTKAIPGTIVQKLFETFINQRLYYDQYLTYDQILEWFRVNTSALYLLTAKDIDDQFDPKYLNARNYFKSEMGRMDLIAAQNSYGLDRRIDPSQIAFVNRSSIEDDYGSEKKFVEFLGDLYEPILEMFLGRDLILNYILSEMYIEHSLNQVKMNGFIDFVYNVNHRMEGFFNTPTFIEDGFVVLDGKYKVNKYTKKEQLMYYASLLQLKYNRIPGEVGFIDWNKAELSMYKFDTTYVSKLKDKILGIKLKYNELKTKLSRCPKQHISLESLELNYNPSTNCIFCPIVSICGEALKRKGDLVRYMQAIEGKRVTDKFMRDNNIDMSLGIQDVSF